MKKESLNPTYFLIMLILISIVGCQNNKNQAIKQDQYDISKPEKNAKVEKSILSLHCDSTVVNNEFSFDVLAFKVFKADTDKIKSLFIGPVVLKMEKQTNAGRGSYYLHDFTDGINEIMLFRNPNEGFYVEDADIKNDKVRLNKKISIGMREDVFLRLVKVTNFKCDTIIVVNDESTFQSVYIFKDAKLSQIKMGQILE
ncbi:hypothetical protein [uncultured Mucilaginibacter sp.]|uniref:hypothetical protein n=1 Tax=uncultured Mucilaginibacter sp. TaxID=797541 RepID=UPI0025D5ACFE|nr:hypothetical protein [uncultured Mucilaginibacter sp.]